MRDFAGARCNTAGRLSAKPLVKLRAELGEKLRAKLEAKLQAKMMAKLGVRNFAIARYTTGKLTKLRANPKQEPTLQAKLRRGAAKERVSYWMRGEGQDLGRDLQWYFKEHLGGE